MTRGATSSTGVASIATSVRRWSVAGRQGAQLAEDRCAQGSVNRELASSVETNPDLRSSVSVNADLPSTTDRDDIRGLVVLGHVDGVGGCGKRTGSRTHAFRIDRATVHFTGRFVRFPVRPASIPPCRHPTWGSTRRGERSRVGRDFSRPGTCRQLLQRVHRGQSGHEAGSFRPALRRWVDQRWSGQGTEGRGAARCCSP